jgi:hypothetical protein
MGCRSAIRKDREKRGALLVLVAACLHSKLRAAASTFRGRPGTGLCSQIAYEISAIRYYISHIHILLANSESSESQPQPPTAGGGGGGRWPARFPIAHHCHLPKHTQNTHKVRRPATGGEAAARRASCETGKTGNGPDIESFAIPKWPPVAGAAHRPFRGKQQTTALSEGRARDVAAVTCKPRKRAPDQLSSRQPLYFYLFISNISRHPASGIPR